MPPAGRREPDNSSRPWGLAPLAVATVAVDAGTKAWAVHCLSGASAAADGNIAFGQHWRLELLFHRGGVWGGLGAAGHWVRVPVLVLVGLSTVVFMVLLYSRTAVHQTATRRGLSLLLGGALGNLVDRIARGQVVDFIDYRADWVGSLHRWAHSFDPRWRVTDHWPSFNVADAAICLGALLLLLGALFQAPAGRPKLGGP